MLCNAIIITARQLIYALTRLYYNHHVVESDENIPKISSNGCYDVRKYWVRILALSFQVVDFLFGGLFKDDESQIFGHVAHRGYTFEVTLTQLPLLPLVIRTASVGLEWLAKDFCSVIHFASLVKIACIGLNFIAFVVAADLVS